MAEIPALSSNPRAYSKQAAKFDAQPSSGSLKINSDAKHHHFWEKSEVEGVKELQTLSKSAKLEEAFIFVKGHDSTGKQVERWYEVGVQENPTGTNIDDSAVLGTAQRLKDDGIKVKEWSLYHIHPLKVGKSVNPYLTRHPSGKDLLYQGASEYFLATDFPEFPPLDFKVVGFDSVTSWETNYPNNYFGNRVKNKAEQRKFIRQYEDYVSYRLRYANLCDLEKKGAFDDKKTGRKIFRQQTRSRYLLDPVNKTKRKAKPIPLRFRESYQVFKSRGACTPDYKMMDKILEGRHFKLEVEQNTSNEKSQTAQETQRAQQKLRWDF